MFIAIGVILIVAGIFLMYRWYGMIDIGLILTIAGLFAIGAGAFKLTVHASGGYPRAGICEVMARATVEPVTVEENEVEEVGADSGEIDLLARLITSEIGYSTAYDPLDYEEACYLTGSVVLNRMKSEKFPDTLQGVIYQPGQYAVVDNGMINRPYDEVAFEIAEELLTYGTTVDESIIYQSLGIQGSGVFRQIGKTYFCYE